MITPPAPWTGSPMKAATFSGPSSRIFVLERGGGLQAELLRRQIAAEIVPIGLLHMMEAGKRQAALAVHAPSCRRGERRHGRAVIAALAADEVGALGLALELPVVAHEAHDRVVGFGARIDEEDMLEALRHQLGDLAASSVVGTVVVLKKVL